MNKLFNELGRRNVFRVAGVYGVVGWLLAQVAATLENAIGLPSWFDGFVVATLLIGFPVAMILAWAFEMTPEGMKPTASVPEGASITAKTGKTLDYVIIGGLALVAVMIVADRLMPEQPGAARTANTDDNASVAVLPFIDLSPDGDQEFFSDGISEEILNVLVRIPELKVAGRTSSFSFKGRNEDLREIGSALGVNHVLEGSVRRSGAQLRITAQLIRSSDGFHLWSETYDREMTDIFNIQDDIAKAVAKELALSLGLKPGQTLVTDRTDDVVAYEKYLKAKQLILARGLDNLNAALLLLNEATARDPNFAPAWASIAAAYAVYEAYQPESPPAGDYHQWRAIGRAAATRAIALDPANAEAYSQLGAFLFYDHDFVAAFKAMDRSVELAPENSSVLDNAAQALYFLGYFHEAEALSKRAIAIDPLVPIFQNTLGNVYAFGGAYFPDIDAGAAELAQYRKVVELNSSLPFAYWNLFWAYFQQSDFDAAAAAVKDGVAAGVIPQDIQVLVEATLLSAARQGEAALRAANIPDNRTMQEIADYLGDTDLLVERQRPVWESDYLYEPYYTIFRDTKIYQHPRWRDQMKKDGVVDLWRSRGFPTWCRATGADDFECDAGSSK
ncbi:tetratricopeptide repeat protein [Hyphococcus sp.]|uniref:tetratricopeptide repeat protein n=1 Tax=Hyphococcus sp. TaxID=2038636 RepID=UPI0037529DEA